MTNKITPAEVKQRIDNSYNYDLPPWLGPVLCNLIERIEELENKAEYFKLPVPPIKDSIDLSH